MKMSFRWYGETDPIPLKYIRQIPNMRSVVTAVYDVKPGKVWPEESLEKLKEQAEEKRLFKINEKKFAPTVGNPDATTVFISKKKKQDERPV